MVVSPLNIPRDPVELSALRAEQIRGYHLDAPAVELSMLAELDHAAEKLDFINQKYFMEVGRAMLIPVQWDQGKKLKYVDFHGLTFEAKFVSFSHVAIGRKHGSPNTVRALCMTIVDAILVPEFQSVDDGALLYVPVLAVNSIQAS